jgi:hypothetical protein
MPEERGEKSNHNNAKDKTPRVENRGGVVAGGQPVGIAHAKLLGRPPASQPHQILIRVAFGRPFFWPERAEQQRVSEGALCRLATSTDASATLWPKFQDE